MERAHVIGCLCVVTLLVSAAVFGGQGLQGTTVSQDEILIQYEDNMGVGQFDGLCSRLSELGFGFVRHYPLSRLLRVHVPHGGTVEEAIAKALRVPGVSHSERPLACQACGAPNDEWYWLQWNLRQIGYEAAWDLFLKDASYADPAVVAVLDTGVAYEDYTDSKYHYEPAPDLGDTEFVDGYDAVNDDYHPNDDNGHGTHMCGVIAQSTNNAVGVASVGFGCKIMPVKVLDEYQSGDTASVAEGIYYAVDNGASVLNLSLGFSWYFSRSDILSDAVSYAADNGVVIVASSGNSALPYVKFPAAYNDCLAVGASILGDSGDDVSRASYSNYGVALDLMAPGGNFQDENEDLYPEAVLAESFDGGAPSGCWDLWWAAGTSAAAAEVSGIAGVLVSLGLDRQEVMAVLKGTASKVDWDPDNGEPASVNEFDCEAGYGLVNVDKAIECALSGVIPQLPKYNASVTITTKQNNSGETYAIATVAVTKVGGEYATGATVYGYWKGSAVGADSKVTDGQGKCSFESGETIDQNPYFEFVVTNIVVGGEHFSSQVEIVPDDIAKGDGMIVRPLRSTGGAMAQSVPYQPWFTSPDDAIY